MPFLGLYSEHFSKQSCEKLRGEIHKAKNPFHTYLRALESWPALFSAYLTSYVVSGYGADGNAAVWPFVSDALLARRRNLTPEEQERLWKAYRRACIRLGLDVIPLGSVQNYRVAEFLHQAGVPSRYLDLLTERMLNHAQHSGTPEADDPKELVLWCNALAERLGPPVPITVTRAIEADRGSFYARLFLRVLGGESDDSMQSDRFTHIRMAEVIAAAQGNQGQLLKKRFAIPRIVWRDDMLGVDLPANSGVKWRIDVDGQQNGYLGASEARFVPLGFPPLPGVVRISHDDAGPSKSFEIWADGRNNRLLAFDEAGSLVGNTRLNAEEPLLVAPGPFTLVMRFPPDGLEAALSTICFDPSLYALSGELGPGEELKLQRGPAQLSILARSHPTLTLSGQAFRGIGGNELYATAGLKLRGKIPVELLADPAIKQVAVLSASGLAEPLEIPIQLNAEGAFQLDLEPICQGWTPGLVRLRIELRQSGLRRSMARLATWLWVGLCRIEDRFRFHCRVLPHNLDLDASDNLSMESAQGILTYRSDAKRFFRLVFNVGSGRMVQFTAAVPGAFMILKRFQDGQIEEHPLRKGTVLALQGDSREVLEVHSTQGGILCLGPMRQEISPRAGLRRLHLSALAEYLEPGTNRLLIQHPSGVLEPLLQLVTPHRVLTTSSREEGGVYRIRLDLPTTADALSCRVFDVLTGKKITLDLVCNDPAARLDRSAYGWLTCRENLAGGSLRHTLEFPLERWQTGAWLIEVEARIKGHWGSLVNERDDIYAWSFLLDDKFALSSRQWLLGYLKAIDAETALSIFKRVHQTLLPCYAPDVWNGISWIVDAWHYLTRLFAPAGNQLLVELLALDALTPPETSPASWFPLLLPGVALPWIYCQSATAYGGLGSRAGLIGKISHIRLPLSQLFVQCYLDQTFAVGFRNAHVMEIDRSAPPHGFSLVRYRQALTMCNMDDAWSKLHREDWCPTEGDYLGPVHWRYALESLVRRYRSTLAGNATRRGRAMHLVQALRHLKLGDLTQGLPAHLDDTSGIGLLVPMPEDGWDQEQENLQLIDRLLCLFAAVCRWESRATVLATWQDNLRKAALGDDAAVTQAIGYLLYVGRDVFEFYLMLWELVFVADADTNS